MASSFDQILAQAASLSASASRTTAYDREESIRHPLLSSEGMDTVLPPVEPTEDELREFLGELPELLKGSDPIDPAPVPSPAVSDEEIDCASTLADEVLEALEGGTFLAPEPIDSDFELVGPVEKCGAVEGIYRAFRSRLHLQVEVQSFQLAGQEWSFGGSEERLTASGPGKLSYQHESTHVYEWGKESDILFWVRKEGETVGYVLNGWVYKLRG